MKCHRARHVGHVALRPSVVGTGAASAEVTWSTGVRQVTTKTLERVRWFRFTTRNNHGVVQLVRIAHGPLLLRTEEIVGGMDETRVELAGGALAASQI